MTIFFLIIAIVIVLIAIIIVSYTAKITKTGKLKNKEDNHASIGKIVTLPNVNGTISINVGDSKNYTHAVYG